MATFQQSAENGGPENQVTASGGSADGASPRSVYELRIYHANEGKLAALIARFRDHTDALFRRHHMVSIGYWQLQGTPGSQNQLVYILQHASREEAQKNWAAFQADPEWKKVKSDSEVNGPLVDRIDSHFMEPTDFSRMK